MATSEVDSEIRAIRDMVNGAVFVNNIDRHGFLWDMACASMDMVGDSQLAIDAFGARPANAGQRYLEIYGLFQAIFLQQDAVVNLLAALKSARLKISDDPDMGAVRVLRNKYFGHPSKSDRPAPTTYHGISRMTVHSAEITGWTYPGFSTEVINVNDVVEQQGRGASRVLGLLRQELEVKRKEYVMRFDGKELDTDTRIYEFGKLYAWAIEPNGDTRAMAGICLDTVDEAIAAIGAGVAERYAEPGYAGDLMRTLEKASFCIQHIRRAMASGGSGDFEDEVYMDALQKAYQEIVEICASINEEFKS